MRLIRIDDDDVRRFQEKIENEGFAGGTINRVTVVLRLILKRTHRQKMMRRMSVVEAVSEKDRKLRRLPSPRDPRVVLSGKVHPEYLEIGQRWSPRWGVGDTKTGRDRVVPIPSLIFQELKGLIEENPHEGEDRYIFYSIEPDRPMNQREATEALIEEPKRIGIPDDPDYISEGREPLPGSRQSWALHFRAWRHTFNSLLVDRHVPLQTVQSVTGHLSDEMTQRYYHFAGGIPWPSVAVYGPSAMACYRSTDDG